MLGRGVGAARCGVTAFGAVPVSAQAGRPAVDWVTDGNDNQRTGWQRNETIADEEERQEPEDPLEDSDRQSGQGAALADAGARSSDG